MALKPPKKKKKETLRSYSGRPLTVEDQEEFLSEVVNSSDRAAAIMISAAVDAALVRVLLSKFVPMSEDEIQRLFVSDSAPFSTLSQKIAMAFAIGAYGSEMKKHLNAIRSIRNVFAHAVRPIKFTDAIVKTECNKLPPHEFKIKSKKISDERGRYTAVCIRLVHELQVISRKNEILPKQVDFPNPIPAPDLS